MEAAAPLGPPIAAYFDKVGQMVVVGNAITCVAGDGGRYAPQVFGVDLHTRMHAYAQ